MENYLYVPIMIPTITERSRPVIFSALRAAKADYVFLSSGNLFYPSKMEEDIARLKTEIPLFAKEGFAVVALSWIVISIFGAFPFYMFGHIPNYIDAIFETEGFDVRQHSKIKIEKSILENIRISMISFKKIKFDYKISGEIKNITINPYGLIIADKYYLVGFNEYVNDLRQYRVDRILNLEILDEYFDKDEKFNLKDYMANSFGVYQEEPYDITLEFNNDVREDVLNYYFHPTQKVKENPDGTVTVKFKAGGSYAICQELFKWGCSVKIKQPLELREYYKTYLSDVLNNQ